MAGWLRRRAAAPNELPMPVTAASVAEPKPQPPPPSSEGTLLTVERDLRTYLPPGVRRFLGYREQDPSKAGDDEDAELPAMPLPFPPFSWLAHIPLKYEIWLLSFLGSFVGIALVEIVNATGFADRGVPLIIASFGATAVLVYGTSESPLAQPRHVLGGHVVSAVLGVAVTKLFRHATAYHLTQTAEKGALEHLVWLNGALCMALSLLAMQITGTVHPPGGATALIAAVNEDAVNLSWRYIYLILISALLMTGWALIINNVGRRRYPAYWLHGKRIFVHTPEGDEERYEDDVQMGAETGSGFGFRDMERVLSRESQASRLRSVASPQPLETWAEDDGDGDGGEHDTSSRSHDSPDLEVVRTPSASPGRRGRSASTRRERTPMSPRLASMPPLTTRELSPGTK
ncbi:Transmembrane protein [Vanrija pseudolonga]|uniref:Transmembrane protein n=1 Tax=Vanrija pseudolonga TaxID=143232 RepID=A0AAF1BK40_9TREE|nr:Transmembrane protein [Vanrija pseudolonga]